MSSLVDRLLPTAWRDGKTGERRGRGTRASEASSRRLQSVCFVLACRVFRFLQSDGLSFRFHMTKKGAACGCAGINPFAKAMLKNTKARPEGLRFPQFLLLYLTHQLRRGRCNIEQILICCLESALCWSLGRVGRLTSSCLGKLVELRIAV